LNEKSVSFNFWAKNNQYWPYWAEYEGYNKFEGSTYNFA
jgi:hypothetical protein